MRISDWSSDVCSSDLLSYDVPDYVKLAEAYGCVGLRAEHPDEVDAVIDKALSIEDRSVVLDFRVDSKEMCFPMVPAGASNDRSEERRVGKELVSTCRSRGSQDN